MAADMVPGRDGYRVPDNRDRGLLMLAWSNGRQIACVSRGEYTGLTPVEVAEKLGLSVEYTRERLLDGEIPTPSRGGGRKITAETIARRRAAGVPEHLVLKTLPEIARKLGVSQHKLNSAIYRGGAKM